jgi:hypothetical protein
MRTAANFMILVAALFALATTVPQGAKALQANSGGVGNSNPGGIHKCRKIGTSPCPKGHGGGAACQPQPVYRCN